MGVPDLQVEWEIWGLNPPANTCTCVLMQVLTYILCVLTPGGSTDQRFRLLRNYVRLAYFRSECPQAVLWEPLPSFVFGLFATSSGLLYAFLPETLGQTLSDTIEETEQKERISNKKPRSVNLIHIRYINK